MSHKGDKYLEARHRLPEGTKKLECLTNIYGQQRPKTARSKTPRRPKTSMVKVTTSPPEDPLWLIESPIPPAKFEFIPLHIPSIKQIISNLCVGATSTIYQQEALRHIVYPPNIIDQRPFDSVARYRAPFNKTNNFRKKAIEKSITSTETLIVALDKFAQEFGGDLSFANKEVSFSESTYRTACGIATLGSTHLLATNHIPTARFLLHTELNYEKDLAKSDDTMDNFIISFATAIAEVIKCENEYVRVLSVDKNDDDEGNANVDFGITSPEQVITEFLANDLEDYARSGFHDNRILKHVKRGKYPCKWMPLLTYLQLRPQDFVTEHNYGYKENDLRLYCERGGYPYNVPVGWYRHALDISKKYPGDNIWLGYQNIEGEWPVAYHGTPAEAVYNITKDELSIEKVERDKMREEAVQQIGSKVDSPGIYLATHCQGGAHPWYTKTFSIYISDKKIERFRVVFQCRVKPGAFTVHKSSLTSSQIWRVVDPSAIRPYGILVRKRKPPKKAGDKSESSDEL